MSQPRRHYEQSLTDEGAFLNGKLVWRNPTPGRWINLSVEQRGGQVWVNGELVYDDEANNGEFAPKQGGPQSIRVGGHPRLLSMGRLSKWFLTLSNLVALWPMLYCVYESDTLLLALTCLISTFHHAAEMRYYAPSLIRVSPRVRWWLWKADQAGAAVAILGLGSLELLRREWFLVAVALLLMLGSEAVMYTRWTAERQIDARTYLHTAWHLLSLGWLAWLAVTTYAHEERLAQTLFASFR